MITFYRISGLLFLFGIGCSIVSLLGRIPQFEIPAGIVLLILSASLGAMTAVIYNGRSAESNDWVINLSIIGAIVVFCIVGVLIQWA